MNNQKISDIFGRQNVSDVRVDFSHKKTDLSAQLLSISPEHLSLELNQSQDSTHKKLKQGDSIKKLRIAFGNDTYELQKLEITQVKALHKKLYLQLVLSADVAEDKSTYWKLIQHVNFSPAEKPAAIPFPLQEKLPARGLYTEAARQERLHYLRDKTEASLSEIEQTLLDPKSLVSNIEAFIGSVELPVGVAGPLDIQGEHAQGVFYVPMATTEGALLASATRGATAVSRAGGVRTKVIKQVMMRVPVFKWANINECNFFCEWIAHHFDEIALRVKQYSNFAELKEIRTDIIGRSVHASFIYQTGDAAGQNMTTTCTWQACQWILEQMRAMPQLTLEGFLIEANFSADKKVAYSTYLKGRGTDVIAECILSKEVCRKVLKVSSEDLFAAYSDFTAGSIAAGMVGFNINVANIIAAVFAATGQDIACVHESSLGQFTMELLGDGSVHVSMHLPSLIVATVGGGTNLKQQKQCLELIDCVGADKSKKLAEIIAGLCLALDISTLSAIASDQFARSHEKLGRCHPVNWLKLADLNQDYFTSMMQGFDHDASLHVEKYQPLTLSEQGSSIITELTAHKINKLVGFYPYQLDFNHAESRNVIVKVKPLDSEVILMLNTMAAMCDKAVAESFNTFKNQLGFEKCHIRELAVMAQQDKRFTEYVPTIYHVWRDDEREIYLLCQEYLENMELMDSAADTSGWTERHLLAAIDALADIHSIWYDKDTELLEKEWMAEPINSQSMIEKSDLWKSLWLHAFEEFPQWVNGELHAQMNHLIDSLAQWYPNMDSMTKTLIHNDFNPRNIFLSEERASKSRLVFMTGSLRPCIYHNMIWRLTVFQCI